MRIRHEWSASAEQPWLELRASGLHEDGLDEIAAVAGQGVLPKKHLLKKSSINFNGLTMVQPAQPKRRLLKSAPLKSAPGRANYAETINLSS
jgi:hypothetical protein